MRYLFLGVSRCATMRKKRTLAKTYRSRRETLENEEKDNQQTDENVQATQKKKQHLRRLTGASDLLPFPFPFPFPLPGDLVPLPIMPIPLPLLLVGASVGLGEGKIGIQST